MVAVTEVTEAKRRWQGYLLCLLLYGGLSASLGTFVGQAKEFEDFRGIYYATRCLLQGDNPYNVGELTAMYNAEGQRHPLERDLRYPLITLFVYLPPTLLLMSPFALLPFELAHGIWLGLSMVALILAAFLMLRIGAEDAPAVSFALICFLLANDEVVFLTGNPAGLVVGLCVVAAWCFVEEKFLLPGVLCLAASLAFKPHDAGFVWLYFLLASGTYRRRAWQSLGIASALGLAALLWVWHVAPRWRYGWHANLTAISAPGGFGEPGPHSVTGSNAGMVIDLQSAITVLWNNPRIYNLITYVICGALLLVWVLRTLKLRGSRANPWLGLAAGIAPALLVTYHRGLDDKLLLLTIPACATLWRKRGVTGWLALLFTSGAIVFTADIPLAVLIGLRSHLPIGMSGILGKALAVVFLEPSPLVLLAMGVFYLWVYLRNNATSVVLTGREQQIEAPLASALAVESR